MKRQGLSQQQNKFQSDIHPSSSWLQRAAVREVPGKEVESLQESGLNRSFVNVPVHGGGLPVVQRKLTIGAENRDEATAQRKLQEIVNNSPQAQQASQLQAFADNYPAQQQQPSQKKASPEAGGRENNTGLPDNLKLGIENLSGYSMDDVKVHYNSDKPAQLQAQAYAKGTEIHIASGQEKYLPHEAWHVVQQKQGRVYPTLQTKRGMRINDDPRLERDADVMGERATRTSQEDIKIRVDRINGSYIGCGHLRTSTTELMNTDGVGGKREKMGVAQGNSAVHQLTKGEAFLIPGQDSNYTGSGWTASGPGVGFSHNDRHSLYGYNNNNPKKKKILTATLPYLIDDQSNQIIYRPGLLSAELAAVDHIVPANSGGGNHPANAQIISQQENSKKADQYPYHTYTGLRIYDPLTDKKYTNITAAKKAKVKVNKLDKKYRKKWVPGEKVFQ